MKRFGLLCVLFVACDVSTATTGSDQDYQAEVLNRASIEFNCPSTEITIVEIDHYTYLAEGCGYRVTYECTVSTGDNGPNECTRAPDLLPVEAGCQ